MRLNSNPTFLHRLGWSFVLLLAGSGLALGVGSILTIKQASILVEWTTVSEIDTAGYNVLRREADGEPFMQVNEQLIVPKDDPLAGGRYSFVDTEVQAGKTYTYILEDVENTGATNRQGVVIQRAENYAGVNLGLSGMLLLSAGIFTWILTRKPIKKHG